MAADVAMPGSSALTPSFVLCRAPHPRESLASVVQWHCTENVVPRLSVLFSLLTKCGGEQVDSVHALARSRPTVRALERVTRQPLGTLEHLEEKVLRAAVDGGEERRIVQGPYEWPEHSRSRRLQALCPRCVHETGYARVEWGYVQAPVYTRHAVRLIDQCPSCSAPIEFNRTGLRHCAACSAALDAAPTVPVHDVVVTAARLVQVPRTRAFGTATYTVPLEPHDLSGLLRLMLLPRFSESVNQGLTGALEVIPVERRVEGLHHLGSAVVAARLDSDALRAIALRRWPYASWLVHDEQMRLLSEACRAVALPLEVTRMLCWGTDQPLHRSAAEVFVEGVPRILGLKKLAEHLNLERVVLNELLSIEGVNANNPADYGFDMDEVLGLERVLRSMPTVEEADALLGWPGVTDELVGMKLLVALRRVDGSLGIHPHSISQLLDRVRERVGVPQTSGCGSTPLRMASELSFDPRQFAWAIAQVIGGSLPASDWEPPFNLVSLRVCERRLRELAKWPRSEAATPVGGLLSPPMDRNRTC